MSARRVPGRIDYLLAVAATNLLYIEIALAAGETIHTQNYHKYRLERIPTLLAEAGFVLERPFLDRQRRFSLNLARLHRQP